MLHRWYHAAERDARKEKNSGIMEIGNDVKHSENYSLAISDCVVCCAARLRLITHSSGSVVVSNLF